MKKTLKPLSIRRAKPRNPHAVAARARKAGAHRVSGSGQRHAARLALRSEIARLHPPPTH